MIAFLFIASNFVSISMGWMIGRTGRNAAVAAQAVEGEGKETEVVKHRPFRIIAAIVVGVVCLVTAFNGLIVASQQEQIVEEHKQFTECVSDQFDLLIDALDARSQSAQDATAQLTVVFRTVAEAWRNPQPDSGERVRAAIEKYIDLRDEANALLLQNPYPEPPRNACSN